MKISYNWIREYFKKIPPAEELGVLLNSTSYEVEGVEKKDEDYLLNIDVLPNRAHDSLCHLGVAREIATVLDLPIVEKNIVKIPGSKKSKISINIEGDFCRRYIARQIDGIEVKESPEELRNKIISIGQRSINNIVDITNLVMFEIGQPMHAFDVNKISGEKIFVKYANDGEKMITLDKQELELRNDIPLIKDSESALAVAGVKGGKKAEVTNTTKNIVLESANFVPEVVRRTAKKISISTESSKRFENEIAPFLCEKAIDLATELIIKYASNNKTIIYEQIDYYPIEFKKHRTGVSEKSISNLLGIKISSSKISDILRRLKFEHKIVKVRETIIEESKKCIGAKYKYGASVRKDAPNFFDCSSFVAYVYTKAGISLPRVSLDQSFFGEEITKENALPGDLVFGTSAELVKFETRDFLPGTKFEKGVSHVAIYLGDERIIHSSRYNKNGVDITGIDEHPDFKNLKKFVRIIKDEKRFVVEIPYERLDIGGLSGIDIKSETELIEEIGRVYGYNKIKDQKLPKTVKKPAINKVYALNNLIRDVLTKAGFSEVMTYSFVPMGEVAPEKPIADDKKYLRTNISFGIASSLEKNTRNADLLSLDHVKIFEIGTVFSKNEEHLVLCLGVSNRGGIKKPKPLEILSEAMELIQKTLEEKIDYKINEQNGTVEINLSLLYQKIKTPESYIDLSTIPEKTKFRTISTYPFIIRDIAVWLPKKISSEKLVDIILDESGELLVNHRQFDTYEKDDRISYAYRLIFQSNDRTLTDIEINEIMNNISKKIIEKGWEVR